MDEFKMRLVSISKAAKILKVSRNTVTQLIGEGKLKVIRVGKRDKILMDDLFKLLKSSMVTLRNEAKVKGDDMPVIDFYKLAPMQIKGKNFKTETMVYFEILKEEIKNGIYL